MNPTDPRHGTSAGYMAGCRLTCCWTAKQRYDKRRRLELHQTGEYRRVPAYRATRRIQALQRLGWSVPAIAARIGLKHQAVYEIGSTDNVYRSTFDKIAAVYEELCMTLPPTTTTGQCISVNKTRRNAERRGWAPPLAWDDIDNDLDARAERIESANRDGGAP